MAYQCIVCQRGPKAGKTISHSHRVTNRKFSPNLHRIKIQWNNAVSREYVCTTCIKSNRVRKAA